MPFAADRTCGGRIQYSGTASSFSSIGSGLSSLE
jgi:hypothetical protein